MLRFCGEELFPVQPQLGGMKVDKPAGKLCLPAAVGAEEQLIGPVGEQTAALVLDPALLLPAAGLRPVWLFRHRGQVPADDDAVLRKPLLEQSGVGGHGRVGKEAALHAAVFYRVCGGQDAHARVVGHGAAHRLSAVAAAAAGGKVQGLDKAVTPQGTETLQTAEIFYRALRLGAEGQKAAVGRDHHVLFLPPLQGQGGTAVGLVAVAEGAVQREKGALGDAPGLAGKDPALLGIETEAAALVQEAAPIEGQKQLGHQVFKHGARPAGKAPVAVLLQLGPAESAPVLFRHVPLGNGDVACQHGLACHQVVPAAGASLPGGVIADIEKATPPVVQRRKVHLLQNGAQTLRKLPLPQLLHGGGGHQQPRVQIAAVHGGDESRVQRQQGAGVVPIIIVSPAAGHPQKGLRQAADIFHALFALDQLHVHGRCRRGSGQADVGGRGAVGHPHRGLLLEIVRGQVVVLLCGEIPEVAPGLPGAQTQIFPVRPAQRILPAGRQRQSRCGHRGQQPHQPRRLADDGGGQQQAQRPRQHGKPHGLHVGGERAAAAVALGGGLPFQQLLPGNQHPPQGGDGGGETDPGLKGQQPEPHEGLDDGPAYAGEQPGIAAQAHCLPALAPALGKGDEQTAQQGQQRGPGCQPQPGGRDKKAGENGDKGGRGNQTAAQAVQQPPAVDVAQILAPAKEPGGVLPVAPDPAVEPPVIGQGLCGEAVGKLRVAHERPPEIGPLQGVVGENAALGKVGFGAVEEHFGVQNALAREAAAVKGVHIQLAAEGSVGVAAPGPGKDQSKVGGVGAFQPCADAGVDDGVALRHHMAALIQPGRIQGMEHGPDQLRDRAGVHFRVAVQGDDIANARKGVLVARHPESGVPVAQKLCQFQQRAPLSLMASVALPVEAPFPGEEIEAAAVFEIQPVYGAAGGAEDLFILLRLRRAGGGQVR